MVPPPFCTEDVVSIKCLYQFVEVRVALAAHAGGLDLLSKVLGCVAGCLQRDAAARADAFNGRPYFRILLGLICELAPAEPGSPEELPSMKMLAAVAVTLEGVQPIRVPGFAFQWLELISHRRALLASFCPLPCCAGWEWLFVSSKKAASANICPPTGTHCWLFHAYSLRFHLIARALFGQVLLSF